MAFFQEVTLQRLSHFLPYIALDTSTLNASGRPVAIDYHSQSILIK
jgi:hypothetical protein